MRRRLLAEALGSFLLFATVVGSGIMAASLAAGNGAIALLANTLATSAMLFVLITILGPISGAHFNPAVTMVFRARNELTNLDAVGYAISQVVGGVAGVWAAHLMFDLPILQVSEKVRSGAGQWAAEGIATFGLVLTILGTLRARPAWVPASVALYIAAAYWFAASTSFANPAITIARSMSNSFAGIAPSDAPAFIVAQLAGALIANSLVDQLFPNQAGASS